jgi:hypothetical protein
MKKVYSFFLSFCLLCLLFIPIDEASFAQSRETLNLDWVQADLTGVETIVKMTPVEGRNLDKLKMDLEGSWSIDDENFGFGAHKIRFGKGFGYTSVYLEALTFNGKTAIYEISVHGGVEWPSMREQIIEAWTGNGGPAFREEGDILYSGGRFDALFEAYCRAVASELGEMKAVDVPADIKTAYEYLISPMNNSRVGTGICGLGGAVLKGKTSIDALAKAERMDLIENVLRGYNPGGRVFAAIALLKMEKRGVKLAPEVKKTMEKVSGLDVPITTCSGCIVKSGLKAKDVITTFVKK